MKKIIKILVIDSEEIILKSVRKALEKTGDEITIAACSTAVEGLKLIREGAFDIILLEPVLPGMNGIEVFRRIKNIYPSMPVIIMSGFSLLGIQNSFDTAENPVNDILSKAAGFLPKPFTTEEINSLVMRIAGMREQIET